MTTFQAAPAVLAGETAIVTGAGQGIGRGIALALAAAGAQVAVVGRTWSTIAAVADEIVNLGSAAGIRWDPSGTGAYAAAKEAVRVLTRTAACEWANDGIRVNAILPLANSSTMEEWFRVEPDAAAGYLATVPLGRLGDPEADIGPAVVFLCSAASQYVTGHTLAVDGGQALVR